MALKMDFVVVVVAATKFFYHICSLEVAAAAVADVACRQQTLPLRLWY